MNIFAAELILFFSIVVVWLGPFLLSLKHRVFNFLHPQTLIPIWITYFVLNALVEKWTPWMVEQEPGIIRTTSHLLPEFPNLFILPLVVVLVSGVFFHLGIRVLSPSVYSKSSFNSREMINYKIVDDDMRVSFLLLAFILSSMAWVPNYLLPNEGLGTFWTYPLAMVNCFIPFMIYLINKPLGILSFGFMLVTGTVLQSKAALIYPMLPIIFYYFYFHFKIKNFFSLLIPVFIILFLWLLLSIGGFGFALAKLFHRDYAFEVFALLIHYSPNQLFGNLEFAISGVLNSSSVSWIWAEIIEGIPSILNPFKGESINPAKLVTSEFLPIDYAVLPSAYFNRFILFAGYHDFGIIGACIQGFSFGLLYSWFYRRFIRRVKKEKLLWPLFVYLPVPCLSTYFIAAGGITYGFINALIPAFLIFSLVYFTKLLRFLRRCLKADPGY